MPGHGTILTSSNGEDDSSIYVDDNNGSEHYEIGMETAVNETGGTLNPGDVVELVWDTGKEELQSDRVGTRATGNVNEEGTTLTITNSGDTALTGTVNISSTYGDNEGFNGETGVGCGNVNGEAAFLS